MNQIGFDSYDLIAGTLAKGHGHILLWVIGAREGRNGVAKPDPNGNFAFALAGRYRGNEVMLNANRSTCSSASARCRSAASTCAASSAPTAASPPARASTAR